MPRKIFSVVRFALNSYRQHWIAAPAGAIASLISTLSAATLMMLFSPIIQLTVGSSSAIFANAVIGPLTAYAIYLSTYYCLMYLKERRSLFDESGTLVAERLSGWFRVVKYDYLAHVTSDIYLITLAGIMQAGLETQGMPIFWAVLASQFVDDFITFLLEPAIWNGAPDAVVEIFYW